MASSHLWVSDPFSSAYLHPAVRRPDIGQASQGLKSQLTYIERAAKVA